MKINRRVRRFHDAWGIKRANGCTIKSHWAIGAEGNKVDSWAAAFDLTKVSENVDATFVLGMSSLEKMRP